MTQLKTCNACSRHVFITETCCPFCKARLPALRFVPQAKPRAGLSRAQRFAFAAAIVGQGAVGCARSEPVKTQPVYGAPFVAGQGGTGGTGQLPQQMYGAPFPGGASGQAGAAGQVSVPVYGASFPDAGQPEPGEDASTDDDAGG